MRGKMVKVGILFLINVAQSSRGAEALKVILFLYQNPISSAQPSILSRRLREASPTSFQNSTLLTIMQTRSISRKRLRLEHGRRIVSEDRLSKLPERIVHDILSRLPCKSVAWMSTLSKKWLYLFETFPGLIFDEYEFENNKTDKKNDWKFCQFLGKFLCRDPIPVEVIRIGTTPCRRSKINHQFEKCLDLVFPSEVRVFELKLRHSHPGFCRVCCCYDLPHKLLSFGVRLTVLQLEGCRIGDVGSVNLPLLKELSLGYVHISEGLFYKIVVGCPSLEVLVIQSCFGLRSLKLLNPSLQRLVVRNSILLKSFYIKCPLLQYIECDARGFYAPKDILEIVDFHIISGHSLRVVDFARVVLSAKVFRKIIARSPHMRTMSMRNCVVECCTLDSPPQELMQLDLEDTYCPQLMQSGSSVESFAFGISVHSCIPSVDDIAPYRAVLFSALPNFVLLKTLSLGGAVLPSDESLNYVISSCPILQNLKLRYCHHLRHLRIISASLQTLCILSSSIVELEGEIETPNLVSFKFEGRRIHLSQVTTSRQLVAELVFRNVEDPSSPLKISECVHYVQKLSGARMLTLSNYFTKCVLIPDEVVNLSLYQVGQLQVSASLGNIHYDDFFAEILHLSLCRSSMVMSFELGSLPLSGNSSVELDLKFYHRFRGKIMTVGEDDNFLFGLDIEEDHDCIEDHLCELSVKITKGHTKVMGLLKFLLGKAQQLRKMSVHMGGELSVQIRSTIIDRIKKMRKASQICDIVFS